jgi:hypothetical protein
VFCAKFVELLLLRLVAEPRRPERLLIPLLLGLVAERAGLLALVELLAVAGCSWPRARRCIASSRPGSPRC